MALTGEVDHGYVMRVGEPVDLNDCDSDSDEKVHVQYSTVPLRLCGSDSDKGQDVIHHERDSTLTRKSE